MKSRASTSAGHRRFDLRFKAACRKARRRACFLQAALDRYQAELDRLLKIYPITLPRRRRRSSDPYFDYPG